jgi:GT2 family glycosyltransferase
MDQNPHVGIAGPKLVYANGKIQSTAARLLPTLPYQLVYIGLGLGNIRLLRNWILTRFASPYDFDMTQHVEAISGAAMIIRRAVINIIGDLDDQYKHCGEDIDYCWRVGRAGWKIAFVHNAVVIHYTGQSSKQAVYRTFLQSVGGTDRYYRLHYGVVHVTAYRLIVTLFRVPMVTISGCVRVLLGREDRATFRQRLAAVRAILRWDFKKVGMAPDKALRLSDPPK